MALHVISALTQLKNAKRVQSGMQPVPLATLVVLINARIALPQTSALHAMMDMFL